MRTGITFFLASFVALATLFLCFIGLSWGRFGCSEAYASTEVSATSTPELEIVVGVVEVAVTVLPTPSPESAALSLPTAIPSESLVWDDADNDAAIVVAKCLYGHESPAYEHKVGLAEVIVLQGLTGWRNVRSIEGAAKYHDEYRYKNWYEVTERNLEIAKDAIMRVRYFLSLVDSGHSEYLAERMAGLVVPANSRYAWESSQFTGEGSAKSYTVHIRAYDASIHGMASEDWDWSLPSPYAKGE